MPRRRKSGCVSDGLIAADALVVEKTQICHQLLAGKGAIPVTEAGVDHLPVASHLPLAEFPIAALFMLEVPGRDLNLDDLLPLGFCLQRADADWRLRSGRAARFAARQNDAIASAKTRVEEGLDDALLAIDRVPAKDLMFRLGRDADFKREQIEPRAEVAFSGRLSEEQEVAPVESRVGGRAHHQIVAAVDDFAVESEEDQICAIT